ncbi:PepSY-associated TM helix domain-containing protein [Alcanivorax hongdengensis A-11-3]|uniref:PepSY-associated TM helix domain-containing protein n=1 Tax=Alcanivorax hongdengensis A-11-3 TaxID=1177179 RepID=L0W9X6_9GAMM|nr:PepSY-associated TM helix domain-containing protein [Alcanivorax hongdengensis]EKF73558.1 PepSY-associated TM helix domain-containing protein [Alcanivorax hongdengensis A-11-3]
MSRRLWRWHRLLGVLAALPVIFLAVTGVLISASDSLGWSRAPVYSAWLGRLYHLQPTIPEQGYAAGEHWLSLRDGALLFDQQAINRCDTLGGALMQGDDIAVLCDQRLLWLDAQGGLLEVQRGLPAAPRQLGQAAAGDAPLALRAAQATYLYDVSSGLWAPASSSLSVHWAQPSPLPEALHHALQVHSPIPGISRERVLLDLHSGRLGGKAGVWLVTATGLFMCLLAITGLISWWRIWRRRRS